MLVALTQHLDKSSCDRCWNKARVRLKELILLSFIHCNLLLFIHWNVNSNVILLQEQAGWLGFYSLLAGCIVTLAIAR